MRLVVLCALPVLLTCPAARAQVQTIQMASPRISAPSGLARSMRHMPDDTSEPPVTGPPQALAGQIVSALDKHPIAEATVQLIAQRTGREIASARTDAEGRYHFAPQAAGRYQLRASAATFRSQLYLEHDGFNSAILLGQQLPTEHLNFELTPGASIHGRILNEAGEPVQRAQVQLYREAAATAAPGGPRVQRLRGMQTNEDGRYDLTDLQAGRYFLAVSATPWYAVHPPPPDGDRGGLNYRVSIDPALDVVYGEVFYPGALSEDGARPLVLREGERISANMNLTPQRAQTVQFRLPVASGDSPPLGRGTPFPLLSRVVFGLEDGMMGSMNSASQRDGVMTVTGLAAGSYHVRQFGPGGSSGAEIPITVGPGTTGVIDLPAAPAAGSLHVRLSMVGGSAVTDGVTVTAMRQPMRGDVPTAAATNGVADLVNLPAGRYRLQVSDQGEQWNVVHASLDGKPLGARVVEVQGAATRTVDLSLTRYAPEVHGTLAGQDHRPFVGAMVLLVPAGNDVAEDLFRRDQSDLDGGFSFPNVAPGNYLVLAVDRGWKLPFTDVAALQPYLLQATPVVVPTSGPRRVKLQDSPVVQPLR